ncbi:MAG: replication protein C, IncQ-type [Comamonas sp.]
MSRVFVHAPGLFRSFKRGDRKRLKLDVTYEVGDATFRFLGPEPLDATDLRVLQGLVALATTGLRSAAGGVPEMLRIGHAQRRSLKLQEYVLSGKTVGVQYRLKPFAEALGYSSPSAATLKRIQSSIERLSAISIIVNRPDFVTGYHLMSGFCLDQKTGVVTTGFNPELTAAILGKNGYLSLSMDEVRKLESDAARMLHARLHWINKGRSGNVGIDTLIGYVYAVNDGEPPSAALRCYREGVVRAALVELEKAGWYVRELPSGAFEISRPKFWDGWSNT